MNNATRTPLLFACMGFLIIATGVLQSWDSALNLLNFGLIAAIMALGVNMQWGYAGLFNVGIMGFVALGGVAAVLVSMPPVNDAWAQGGLRMIFALAVGVGTIIGAIMVFRRLKAQRFRGLIVLAILVIGAMIFRALFGPARDAIEAVNPAGEGYLGGLGLPILLAWPIGALFAAGAAWIVGKTALGLRSDYLAIATLGISEIILAVIRNEDWLTRGVKNVNGLPRPWPVPYEIELQEDPGFLARAEAWGMDPVGLSTLTVKLAYAGLFLLVLLILMWLAQKALQSPWGRMMRAIRDNETAAEAMGKDVKKRHLHIFVIGSAVCGLAGAMMTTMDGLLNPGAYQPLRYTFLIWVMVIVGGSGNNWGAVLGGMLVWFLYVQVEPLGTWLMSVMTAGLDDGSALKQHLIDNAIYMRFLVMGIFLLLVLRFSPRGLIPER
ncbi:MAG: branched-chain amino acid ABC transporter permease [Dinoroseobacter sp.]|nr:branched-chain amino acid ABC transporter permease [Dinoroseobacter sp.]